MERTLDQLNEEREQIKALLKVAQELEDRAAEQLKKFADNRRSLETRLSSLNAKITLHSIPPNH